MYPLKLFYSIKSPRKCFQNVNLLWLMRIKNIDGSFVLGKAFSLVR